MHKLLAILSVSLLLAPPAAFASGCGKTELEHEGRSSLGAHSRMFDMRATSNGHLYRIHVALPPGVLKSSQPPTRFPVVYLLDADWHFPLMAETVRALVQSGDIDPVVVVGIGYPVKSAAETIPLRTRDFTVAADRPHEALLRKILGDGPEISAGGAPAFLSFIQQQLKPEIAARFPADNSRSALFGHSLGGTFGFNVLFRTPGSFSGYALSSPPVLWGDEEMLKLESAWASQHQDLTAKLVLSVGGEERNLAHVLALPPQLKEEETRILALFNNPDPVAQLMEFDSKLKARTYPGLQYDGLTIYPGHSHGSVVIPAFASGLLAFFKPIAGGPN